MMDFRPVDFARPMGNNRAPMRTLLAGLLIAVSASAPAQVFLERHNPTDGFRLMEAVEDSLDEKLLGSDYDLVDVRLDFAGSNIVLVVGIGFGLGAGAVVLPWLGAFYSGAIVITKGGVAVTSLSAVPAQLHVAIASIAAGTGLAGAAFTIKDADLIPIEGELVRRAQQTPEEVCGRGHTACAFPFNDHYRVKLLYTMRHGRNEIDDIAGSCRLFFSIEELSETYRFNYEVDECTDEDILTEEAFGSVRIGEAVDILDKAWKQEYVVAEGTFLLDELHGR